MTRKDIYESLENRLEMPVVAEHIDQIAIDQINIEGIAIEGFANKKSYIDRLVSEVKKPGQFMMMNLNVHAANLAHKYPRWRKILDKADMVICDGAGIQLASKLQGNDARLERLTYANWLVDALKAFADEGITVYFLGSEPGIAETAIKNLSKEVPNHTIIGHHHGYILNKPEREAQVIEEINELKPDVLFVGMGMPNQEYWIDKNRDHLQVRAITNCGAMMDYFANKVPRCPTWMGDVGLEWVFRLSIEPNRLFHRYMVGNPWFLGRLFFSQMNHYEYAIKKTQN